MEIKPQEIIKAYKNAFNIASFDWFASWLGLGVFRLTNLKYNPLDFDVLAEAVALDLTDEIPYVYNEHEKYTCDDYSFSLLGAFHRIKQTAAMPIFKLWMITPIGHAVVSFYDGGNVYIIEPQTDEIMNVAEAEERYGGRITLSLLNG